MPVSQLPVSSCSSRPLPLGIFWVHIRFASTLTRLQCRRYPCTSLRQQYRLLRLEESLNKQTQTNRFVYKYLYRLTSIDFGVRVSVRTKNSNHRITTPTPTPSYHQPQRPLKSATTEPPCSESDTVYPTTKCDVSWSTGPLGPAENCAFT
jgi:hypothetical protein